MPKIPTFESQGRPTAEVGGIKTSFQVPVTNDIFTKAQSLVADYYIKEREEEAKIKSLDYENKLLPKLYDAYDKHSKNPFPSEASSSFLKEGKEIMQSIADNELAGENNFVKRRFLAKGNASLSTINLATLQKSRLLMEEEKKKVLNDAKSGIFTELAMGAIDIPFAQQKVADLVNSNISDPDPTVSVNKKKFELDSMYKAIDTLAMQKDSHSDSTFLDRLKKDPNLYSRVDLDDRIKFISYAQARQEKAEGEFAQASGKSIIAESKFDEGADTAAVLAPVINSRFTNPQVREKVTDAVNKELINRSQTFREKGAAEYYLNSFPSLKQEYASAIQDPNKFLIYKQSMDRIYLEKQVPEQYRTYVPNNKVVEIVDTIKGSKNADQTLKIVQNLNQTYGMEIMPSLFKQLNKAGLETNFQVAMTTNSLSLQKDIFASASNKDLEEQAKKKLSTNALKAMENNIFEKTKEYREVILNQKIGAEGKTEYLLSFEKTLYNAALNRVVNSNFQISPEKAVKSVTDEWKADYDTTQRTYFIPKDVNGVPVSIPGVKDKADAVLLAVEKTDYLEKMHGKDGFAHYADEKFKNNLPENLKLSTPEQFNAYVKEKMISYMKKQSKWLLNNDSTGIVLHVELNNGTIPIINKNGEKIEFLFADMPNKKNKIKSTDMVLPVTGNPLPPLIQDSGLLQETTYSNQ
jgi:hypothetical protein